MKLILLSGGSGKRLWPLSNDIRSKQFLRILEDGNGEYISMVQRVWKQLETTGLSDSTYIATSKAQVEILHRQLGLDIPLIIEPERRDTFPAIALASAYLCNGGIDRSEIVVVMPVDPYVDITFFERLKELELTLQATSANLALMGVKPTYPSTEYGYIIPESSEQQHYFKVERFAEKPTETEATTFIQQNALWNCGIFAFRLGYMLDKLKDKGYPLTYHDIKNAYHLMPKISFDYEVVEKERNIVALSYEGSWKDLGTWDTLSEEMSSILIGKGVISKEINNTHVLNELEIPVVVNGLSDTIVVASPDGILVTEKNESHKVKELIKNFNNPPMYEERIWGWSKTLDYAKYKDKEMVTKRICIQKDKNSTYHYHKLRDEVWTIVKGKGELIVDGELKNVNVGDTVYLPVGCKHAIRATEEIEFIEVQTGSVVLDEDFTRLYNNWDEILLNTGLL